MKSIKPLIVVLSRNYSTALGVIRSLGIAGYEIDLIASVKKKGSSKQISCSKYIRKSREILMPDIRNDNGEDIVGALMEYASIDDRQIVLFPTDDVTMAIIDRNRDNLRQHFIMPCINKGEGSILEYMDKNIQSDMASRAGLSTPEQTVVSLKSNYEAKCEEVKFPCFVKPVDSISGYKTEMKKCKDFHELISHLNWLKSAYSGRNIIIQEFLDIEHEYDVAGVSKPDGILIPGVIEKTRTAMYERGVAMCGRMVGSEVLGDLLPKISDMIRNIGYVGMFDIDLIKCRENIYFGEINFRSGGLNFAYFLNGVNLPDIYIRSITDNEDGAEKSMKCETGKSFIYEKVAWEDYIHGYINHRELKEFVKGSDYTLLEYKEDPSPGIRFAIKIRLSLIKQRVKKGLKWKK